MVSLVQQEKVQELLDKGFELDRDTIEAEWDGGFTSPTYMKNKETGKIVKIDTDGKVEDYKPRGRCGNELPRGWKPPQP